MPPIESPPTPQSPAAQPLPPSVVIPFLLLVALAVAGLKRLMEGSWPRAGQSLVAPGFMLVVAAGVWAAEHRRGRPLPRWGVLSAFVLGTALGGGASAMLFPARGPVWGAALTGALFGMLIGFGWVRGRHV